jgi:two-component system sensor histidine kinase/response regulator
MTANAMKADLDACLAAGMNDHVTKPIDRKALLETLRRWLPTRKADRSPVTARSPESRAEETSLPGIEVAATLERLGLDRATLDRMLLRFADGQGPTLDALRSAVAGSDRAAAARHAHAIAGAAGNLGADRLRTAAKALEQAGRDGHADLAPLLADVEAQAAIVFSSIGTLRRTDDTAASSYGGPFDPEVARAALQRLDVALGASDLSAVSGALTELGSAGLPRFAQVDFSELRESVEGYDYDQARGIAARLLARVNDVG